MGIYDIRSFAETVKGNSYVGRGIVAGLSADGKKAVTAYFIMGRSTNAVREDRHGTVLCGGTADSAADKGART